MQWVLLRAVDDSRFSVSRKAHRLSPVEFRVLKRSQAKQTISKRGRQVLPSNIDLIRENQLQALRQRLKDRSAYNGATAAQSTACHHPHQSQPSALR